MEDTYTGTIIGPDEFNAEKAAMRLHKAMKGMGSDERLIIEVLVKHNGLQRQEIEEQYKTMYGRDLKDDLKDELGGHFEETVIALLTSRRDIEVIALKDAMEGIGTKESTLIEILCCKTPDEMYSLNRGFERATGKSLDSAVEDDLGGDFQYLIRGLVAGGRDEGTSRDSAKAIKDAQDLYDAGIGQNPGTDESEFIRILNTRSYPQLDETFKAYANIAQEPIKESIEREFSGDLAEGLLAIVQRVNDPLGYFAERIYNCIDGPGTDDATLIRLIVLRSEIDLEDIKKRYKEMYSTELSEDVKKDCSGDYRKLLLAIIGN